MKIAVAQLNSTDDLELNYKQMAELILQAANQSPSKPRIIFFPENSLYFRIDSNEPMPKIEISCDQIKKLEQLSLDTGIYLHLTTSLFIENKNWNASILISPEGKSKVIYKKIHLFDIQLNQEKAIRESDVFSHGDQITTFEIDGVIFGSSICYDVRFAELYSQLVKKSVDAILVPAAFLVKTGQAHWEILLRARAIESQAFVIASAQVGLHKSSRVTGERSTYGHSMIVDPWGKIIESKPDGVGLIFVEINKELRGDVQKQIPMANHRRL